ncbi:hypothetical protein PYW08_012978 [Mythimna loreyi]|uniref:Uncharacterized protein n=1 Tax=Mythimna loreyi TaxID=667449 RepID=A0ACC2PZ85_9NEOP|nr:hypothetical protein PYW08_012978 [Mythimna loreyi]
MEKLELQSACFENIKTLCVNYRKDSESRKTVEYLKKRLTSLENQWQDFENRHAELLLELEDKNIEYFKDDIFRKTQDMFVTTKMDITEKLATLEKRNVKFDLGGTSEQDTKHIQLLLNKQEQRQYHSDITMDYELTAPTFDASINKIVNLTYRYGPNILQSKITNQEIAAIEQKIATQRKNEISLPTKTSHDIHQYAICYFLLTAAIIAVLVVVGRNRCAHYCTNNPKTKTTSPPPEDIELQVIRQPEYQQDAVAARVAQTTKDLRRESRPGHRNVAFQFD